MMVLSNGDYVGREWLEFGHLNTELCGAQCAISGTFTGCLMLRLARTR